jgi:hypothetical protein
LGSENEEGKIQDNAETLRAAEERGEEEEFTTEIAEGPQRERRESWAAEEFKSSKVQRFKNAESGRVEECKSRRVEE